MKKFLLHIKTYTVRGFWAIIPLALSFFAVRLLYISIDQRIMNLLETRLGFRVPGLGIALSLITLYGVGIIASNVLGRQLLGYLERISSRIPVIKTTYRVGRQLAATFTLPERQFFRRAVLVSFLKPGMWTVGFVTGRLADRTGETWLKVYIPTPPNPASGTLVIVKESETRDPKWTIEEAMKAVISAGLIGPDEMA